MSNRIYISFLALFCLTSCGGGSTPSQALSIQNPVINTFTSSSYSAVVNTSIALTWTSSNSSTCTATNDWVGSKSTNGTEDINLLNVKIYTFTLTCLGQAGSTNSVKSIEVDVISSSTSNIYDEIKNSYCKEPLSNSSEYWIEEFSTNTFNSDLFTYQLGNGFNTSDGSWVSGWGNDCLLYTSPSPRD